MNRRIAAALLSVVLLVTLAAAQEKAAAPADDAENTLYALGVALSQNIQTFDLSETELKTVLQGLEDGVLGREPKVQLEAYAEKIQKLALDRRAVILEREKKLGAEFVEASAKQEGARKLDSGLVYREIEAGSGEQPAEDSVVRIHYHGTLRDGTVFDSSREKEPVSFSLNGVIPCFKEGLMQMKVGGTSQLVCPADIAYGERGRAPMIAPGAALSFEVELLEIVDVTTGQPEAGTPPEPPESPAE